MKAVCKTTEKHTEVDLFASLIQTAAGTDDQTGMWREFVPRLSGIQWKNVKLTLMFVSTSIISSGGGEGGGVGQLQREKKQLKRSENT